MICHKAFRERVFLLDHGFTPETESGNGSSARVKLDLAASVVDGNFRRG